MEQSICLQIHSAAQLLTLNEIMPKTLHVNRITQPNTQKTATVDNYKFSEPQNRKIL